MKFRMERNTITRRKREKSHHHTPITKPADSEISVFEKHLERATNGGRYPKILIMGSSPELRNLTAKRKLRTTVVADDLEVIERTSKLMKRKNENEQWLEGDITSLPLKKNSFDVIFGDHIISNLPPFNTEKFYRRMREILKGKGFAVIRSVIFTKTEKPFEGNILKHFRIVEREFGEEGVFAEHFPIYFMRPK
ncbi:MAG: class I SAM-dependent methyltransferase [Candidatus Aenigmarchaeota archaeon]